MASVERMICGNRDYELTNHLGNVMATISDRKDGKQLPTPLNIDEYDYYEAAVRYAADYYPFGMEMPDRTYSSTNNVSYRYGFNGKENDRGIFGEGPLQDYGMRMYNPALGRFLSVDPIAGQYPELTPYQFASNTPIQAIDLDGLEALFFGTKKQVQDIQLSTSKDIITNITYTAYEMISMKNAISQVKKDFEYMEGKRPRAIYLQTHGTPGEVYTDPGPDGVYTPPRSATSNHSSDDIGVDFNEVERYLSDVAKGEDPTKFEGSRGRVHELKLLMDEIDDGGALVLGGCTIACTKDKEANNSMLEKLYQLSGQRIHIVANQDRTTNLTSNDSDGTLYKEGNQVINSKRTKTTSDGSKFQNEAVFSRGWSIIGPLTGGKVNETGQNLILDGSNRETPYKFEKN